MAGRGRYGPAPALCVHDTGPTGPRGHARPRHAGRGGSDRLIAPGARRGLRWRVDDPAGTRKGGRLSPVDAAATNVGAGNWKGLGMWAWLLFRIAGIVLVVYLFAHIGVISSAALERALHAEQRLHAFDHPLFVLLDLLLVWAVLFHALNGVRILLMDFGFGIHSHKAVFVGAAWCSPWPASASSPSGPSPTSPPITGGVRAGMNAQVAEPAPRRRRPRRPPARPAADHRPHATRSHRSTRHAAACGAGCCSASPRWS